MDGIKMVATKMVHTKLEGIKIKATKMVGI